MMFLLKFSRILAIVMTSTLTFAPLNYAYSARTHINPTHSTPITSAAHEVPLGNTIFDNKTHNPDATLAECIERYAATRRYVKKYGLPPHKRVDSFGNPLSNRTLKGLTKFYENYGLEAHEDLSPKLTQQFPTEVEFRKRSNTKKSTIGHISQITTRAINKFRTPRTVSSNHSAEQQAEDLKDTLFDLNSSFDPEKASPYEMSYRHQRTRYYVETYGLPKVFLMNNKKRLYPRNQQDEITHFYATYGLETSYPPKASVQTIDGSSHPVTQF